MRVGFDVSACEVPHSPGVRRVARTLLATLEERAVLEVVRLAPPPGTRRLGAWRLRELPRAVERERLVGLHSFVSGFAWRGPGWRVQTVHELPWTHGVAENASWRHRLWAALGPRLADRVVCPSEHVARDLGKRANVRVVPWGVEERFREEPDPGAVDEVLLERYRLGGDPLVLCPGAVRAKKNLAAVLRAAARLVRAGTRLEVVVTGGDTPALRRDLGLASRLGLSAHVTTLAEVDEADLPGLYRLAAVVPVLSVSEGFALPVLEALGCGTPVVVPRDSAQAEVAGDDAFLVDAESDEDVARALGEAIRRREELRFRLPARARAFPWTRTAKAIEELWRELAP